MHATPASIHFRTLITKINGVFYDSALFLTFSIQIAATVVLARSSYGIDTNGIGDITVRITWVVSLLTLLPLVYGFLSPGQLELLPVPSGNSNQPNVDQDKEEGKRQRNMRALLFLLSWGVSFYPFLSRAIAAFSQSLIGDEPGSVISTAEWDTIVSICFSGVPPLRDSEDTAMTFFGLFGWLLLSAVSIVQLVGLGIQKHHEDSRIGQYLRRRKESKNKHRKLQMTLFATFSIIIVVHFWMYFRLQSLQVQVADHSGNSDVDGQWTFGQVVAVTVFFPVLVEGWYAWKE